MGSPPPRAALLRVEFEGAGKSIGTVTVAADLAVTVEYRDGGRRKGQRGPDRERVARLQAHAWAALHVFEAGVRKN